MTRFVRVETKTGPALIDADRVQSIVPSERYRGCLCIQLSGSRGDSDRVWTTEDLDAVEARLSGGGVSLSAEEADRVGRLLGAIDTYEYPGRLPEAIEAAAHRCISDDLRERLGWPPTGGSHAEFAERAGLNR